MQVQKVSFTSAEQPVQQPKESALYSKKGYMWQVGTDQFLIGAVSGYGLLEAVDKFQLIKNKKNLSAQALKQKAWKHTKYNLLIGLATGIASVLIGKYFINKYTIPFAEKTFDNLVKQEKINEKAKELVEAENKTEAPKELKEETPKETKIEASKPEPEQQKTEQQNKE